MRPVLRASFAISASNVGLRRRPGLVGRLASRRRQSTTTCRAENACDTVVIGAGVVGLAVARALSMSGLETIVLESEGAVGTITSSRNSEVVHAGIYYAQGSLKARLCVQGRSMLYSYCDSHGVPYKRCGKLIVATNKEEERMLEGIAARALANGVDDLQMLTGAEAALREPEVVCTAALLSPSTGVIDSHSLMLALQGDAEDHGAMIAFNSPVEAGGPGTHGAPGGGFRLRVGGDDPMEITCRNLVNAAGLAAPAIAALLEDGGLRLQGLEQADGHRATGEGGGSLLPRGHFAKGNYYRLEGQGTPFTSLVYPVPQKGLAGLGVHATVDMGGQTRFGPDVEWVEDDSDYTVDPARADGFYAAVRRYWPRLRDGALLPDYSGIRPKLQGAGEAAAHDFVIMGEREHGVPGLVHLLGIESPGLTSCLAIAAEVEATLKAHREPIGKAQVG